MGDELYDIFGKYGSLRQIRRGNGPETRGTCFIVYDDIYDAKNAMDHLSGFNVAGRYLVLLYYNPTKMNQKSDPKSKREDIDRLKTKYGAWAARQAAEQSWHVRDTIIRNCPRFQSRGAF